MRNARSRPSLAGDEHGAIMVLGIFMCVFLVGALWYIIGLGDVLMYHERMQEASDAVAFSSAVITARGMNIIVLLNLIMAAILAIRVAINLLKWALIIVAGIAAGLAAIPGLEEFLAIAEAAGQGAEDLQTLDNDLKQPIDDALIALHEAEQGVKYLTPPAAFAGAQYIVSKYQPLVSYPGLVFGSTIGTGGYGPSGGGSGQGGGGGGGQGGSSGSQFGLPIVDGSTSKLCQKAFDAVGELIDVVMPSGVKPFGFIMDKIGGMVTGLGVDDAFCELGGSGDSQQLMNKAGNLAGSECDSQKQAADQKLAAANQKLQQAYANHGWSSDGTPPANWPAGQATPSDILIAQQQVNKAQSTANGFDNCKSDAANKQQATLNKVNSKGTSQGVAGNKTPAMVDPKWHNGIRDAQLVSVVLSTSGNKFVNTATKYEQIASGFYHDHTVKYDTPGSMAGINVSAFDPRQESVAQAEFFYDGCKPPGHWQPDCDDNEEAMWNFHWRARLRLVNPDAFLLGKVLQGEEIAMKGKIAIDIALYGKKRAEEGLNLNAAWEAITPVQLAASLANEPLTLH